MEKAWSTRVVPVALSIAGSDPSGGAGIQADLKTFHQFGVFGEAVLTLLTVQNTQGVTRVETMSAELVREQIEALLLDVPPGAAKTGALGNAAVIKAVGELAQTFQFPLVVDPVMISKHGAPLLAADAVAALREQLLPFADLLTPNIPEAEALTGLEIEGEAEMVESARRLRELGAKAVLVKGGHRAGEPVDVLVDADGMTTFRGERVRTKHTHGTGCTYAAAITARLAMGDSLRNAIRVSRRYVENAIRTAPGLGSGQGPVNHFAPVED